MAYIRAGCSEELDSQYHATRLVFSGPLGFGQSGKESFNDIVHMVAGMHKLIYRRIDVFLTTVIEIRGTNLSGVFNVIRY